MKILLISNMYPSPNHPTYGIFVKNFENGIIENRGTIHKAVIKGRGKNKLEKILKYLKFFSDVVRSIFTKKYDLIYVHYAEHSLLPLLFIKPLIRKPIVINAHGDDLLYDSFVSSMVKGLIKRTDLLVVPSEYFRTVAIERYGLKKEKIFISPSGGIDTKSFKPLDSSNAKSVFSIGYVSRIDEGKGWKTLLLAVGELKKIVADEFKIVLIGGGAQEIELRSMIMKLGLKNNIDYLGPIPHEDLVGYYNNFDLFVFPTLLAESLGLVGLEAMACGVPVVGSDIGGLKGYIDSGYNGVLFEPGNHKELAKKIGHFMEMNINEKEAFRKHAIATAQEYDSEQVSHELYRRLEMVLEERA